MIQLSLADIAEITKGRISKNPSLIVNSIITDSRNQVTIKGGLFVAIKGKQHDSHKFLEELYQRGVRSFLVEYLPEIMHDDAGYILVENSLHALQLIASNHRKSFSIPTIGITGSNGKTIVKEWLYYLLSDDKSIVRSPKSYNSQIGVPLSVSLIEKNNDLAIFEAGISEPNEMEKLQPIIQPTIGIFTNIGNAHQEYFTSIEQKISEKLRLFIDSEVIIYSKDFQQIDELITKRDIPTFSWSIKGNQADVIVSHIDKTQHESTIGYLYKGNNDSITIPFNDNASIENAICCLTTLLYLGYSPVNKKHLFKHLPPIAMRLELKEGHNNSTIINDSYNSDLESLKIALDFLNQQNQHNKKVVILSDIQQTGIPLEQLYSTLFTILEGKNIDSFIGIGPDLYKCKQNELFKGDYFFSTEHFIEQLPKYNFSNCSILIKGARAFKFERITNELEQRLHQTVLEVDLNALTNNLNYFRSLLNPKTKIIVMVKAFSYGSGSFEIANLLQHHRVDYLAVAFADEGIELRKAGITVPILVMNPEPETFDTMIEHLLEPEIYSFRILSLFISALERSQLSSAYPIHIKFDTGMARMGFNSNETVELITFLKQNTTIKVASIFSHLCGSDDTQFDNFTLAQIAQFDKIAEQFNNKFNYHIDRHILNSAGIERFPQAQYEMVRLGIGLYGISAIQSDKLQNISTLKTCISQIRTMQAGQTVGYSRKWKIQKPSTIAVIPIGYADGLNRKFSNGVGEVLINGHRAPIIGNVCMDATMVDITGIDAQEGDGVIIFGKDISISEQASKIETIPYEILTSIARRVKRVYIKE
jgi:Alr-MurF fusion protein